MGIHNKKGCPVKDIMKQKGKVGGEAATGGWELPSKGGGDRPEKNESECLSRIKDE